MANPRKFSEKIAIQKQKQAEETAAFEQVMRDVITATRGSNHASSSINKNQQHLHINPSVGNCRAESLPDVNRIGVSLEQSSIDLKSALNNLEDMRRGREPTRRYPSPNATSRSPHRHQHISGGHYRSSYNEQRRGDSSPYSPVYLSPPMDSNWRRTNSDSALHQTGLMAEQMAACSPLHQPCSPLSPEGPHSGASSPRRSTVHNLETTASTNAIYSVASTPSPNSSEYNTNFPVHNSWDPGKKMNLMNPNFDLMSGSLLNDSRPKSTGGVPGIKIDTLDENNVNNNNILHQHQQNHLQNPHLNHQAQQHPSFAITGSLPDLTNLSYTNSLSQVIDFDDHSLSPVTHMVANTMINDTYPNSSPSPGSPYNCVPSSTSVPYANQSTNNYSSSPSSSASFVQQSTIFTQSTFASHNETNNSNNNHNNTNHTNVYITNNTNNNCITANLNTHTNTAINTETTSNLPTDLLLSNQDFPKGNGSTIILPSHNPDLSELLANEDTFRQPLEAIPSIDFEDLLLNC